MYDYPVPPTPPPIPAYPSRVIVHKINYFAATWDFTSLMCPNTVLNYGADTPITVALYAALNLPFTAVPTTPPTPPRPLLPVTTDCPTVLLGPPY